MADESRKPRGKDRLLIRHMGPIRSADITFGDLTVIVGPQATGKSVVLQTLKLIIDRNHVHDTFRYHSVDFGGDSDAFLDGYFGRGMAAALGGRIDLTWNGDSVSLEKLAKPSKAQRRHQQLLYIAAQRVMSLPGGVSQNFGQFNYGDPYSLRAFSDAVHDLIQNEFGAKGELFPAPNRLNETLRAPIAEHLFGRNRLVVDDADFTKRLALTVGRGQRNALGFLSWSAGQREFVPMLMGLYWLCTVTAKRKSGRRKNETIDWVVIEEPEMGLHPQGISAVLLMVLELLRRNYRVVLSTHSPVVLEMVWALQELKKHAGTEAQVRQLFQLPASGAAKALGKVALEKDYHVAYFGRDGRTRDISDLDPGSDSRDEAEWGGILGFSVQSNHVVAAAVNRAEIDRSAQRRKRRRGADAEET